MKKYKKKFNFWSGGQSYSAFYKTKSKKLYCFGYNGYGELGNGTRNAQNRPLYSNATRDKTEVMMVSMGWGHCVILDKKKRIWTCGRNDHGQLCLGNRTQQMIAQNIVTLNSKNIYLVACGYQHSIFIGKNESFGGGSNNTYQLGIGNNISQVTTPTKINLPRKEKVIDVCGGLYFTCFVMKSGKIFKTGRINTEPNFTTPTELTVPESSRVVMACAGYLHLLVLTKNGNVHSMGQNSNGQLGTGNTSYKNSLFTIEVLKKKKIRSISAGFYHSMALEKNGEVFSWGQNNSGQLGRGNRQRTLHPFIVMKPKSNIVQIEACGYHSYAISKTAKIFGAGANGSGQLCQGNNTANFVNWTPMPLVHSISKIRDFGNDHEDYDSDDEDHEEGLVSTNLNVEKRDFLIRFLYVINSNDLLDVRVNFSNGKFLEFFRSFFMVASSGVRGTKTKKDNIIHFNVDEKLTVIPKDVSKLCYGLRVKIKQRDYFELYNIFRVLGMHRRSYLILKRISSIESLMSLLDLYKKTYWKYERTNITKKNHGDNDIKKKEVIVKIEEKEKVNEDHFNKYLTLDDEDDDDNDNNDDKKNEKNGEIDSDDDDDLESKKKPKEIVMQYKSAIMLAIMNELKEREEEIKGRTKIYEMFKDENLKERIQNHITIDVWKHIEFNNVVNVKSLGFSHAFKKDLKELYVNRKEECNISLLTYDNETFRAHQEVLLMNSNYFKMMDEFEGIESDEFEKRGEITLETLTSEMVREILYFIYTSDIKCENIDMLFRLLEHAKTYREIKMRRKIVKKIKSCSRRMIKETNIYTFLREYIPIVVGNKKDMNFDLIQYWSEVGEIGKSKIFSFMDKEKTNVKIEKMEMRVDQLQNLSKFIFDKLTSFENKLDVLIEKKKKEKE